MDDFQQALFDKGIVRCDICGTVQGNERLYSFRGRFACACCGGLPNWIRETKKKKGEKMSNPTIEYAEPDLKHQSVHELPDGSFFYLQKDRARLLYRKIKIGHVRHILLVSEGRLSDSVKVGDCSVAQLVNVRIVAELAT